MTRAGAAVLLVALASGCTKVNEQPVARQEMTVTPPPAPAAPKPSAPTGYTFPSSSASSLPPPPASKPPAVDAGAAVATLNGDPKGLVRDDLSRAMDGALPSLASCFGEPGGPSSVGLSFEADPSGRASNVKVRGGSPAAERCVTAAMAAVRLPSFEGKPVPVDFPLTVQRTVPAAAPAPSAPAPTGGGRTGVFVNP